MNALQPILALTLVNALYGLGYPLVKMLVSYMTPGEWIVLRISSCAIILMLFCYREFFSRAVTVKQLAWLALASLLGMVINQICFVEGLARTLPAHSAIVNATIPLQTILFSRIFLRENLTTPKLVGVGLGFFGVLILIGFGTGDLHNPMLAGDGLTLMNAAAYALFLIVSPRAMKGFSPTLALLWMTLLGVPFTFAYVGFHLPVLHWATFPLKVWGALAYLILIQTVFTYTLNLWALQKVTPSHASLYVYLQPVVAAIAAFYLLGDHPGTRFYVSGAFIFAGILLASLRK